MRRVPAESGDKWLVALFFLTLCLTPLCYLLVYANWSMPFLGSSFLDTFSRFPWLRTSFILTTVTFLFPFSGLYRAEDPVCVAQFCPIIYGGTLLPAMILATYPGLQILGLFSDPNILYVFLLVVPLHAAVARIVAWRLLRSNTTT
jgi:hypothetical protein